MLPTVILFLKSPRPGFVKTRLAADLGDHAACQIYRHLAEKTLAQVPDHWPCHITFTPADAEPEMAAWLGPQHHYHAQSEGDLGQRLAHASQEAFDKGASSVILLGGDCPEIRSTHLEEASQHLAKNIPVIGPARDQGYWLLGLTQHCPEIFEKIAWSTPAVLEQTLKVFKNLGLRPHHLPVLEDIDTLDSWARHPELKKFAINPPLDHPKSS